jgi:pentatricopeptide repeat protein
MQDLYQRKIISEPPNIVCYTSVMTCWAHSQTSEGANRAEDWLRVMQAEQSDSKKASHTDRRIRPNRIAYNIVMNAWANVGDCDRVDSLFEELVEKSRNDRRLKPDEYTYRAVLKGIRNSHKSTEEKAARTTEVMRSMETAKKLSQ